jgi:DNA-binding transcriptional MerR regulator
LTSPGEGLPEIDDGDTAAELRPLSGPAGTRARKSPSAFRTISEVADELHIPQHVLRFWETRFPQVKPLKRGGGRRYYRPDDIALLRSISHLLYIQGYTIKGVQRLLREGGGALAEDIPPASEADRREDETGELDLAPPDLAPPAGHLLQPGQAAPDLGGEPGETHRHVLLDLLAELEALRALLPD